MQDLTLYVHIDRHWHILMIHTGISGRCEMATIYQRRIKLSAGDNISLWHNFDDQHTWGWFLHFQTVHQRQVGPEFELAFAAKVKVRIERSNDLVIW